MGLLDFIKKIEAEHETIALPLVGSTYYPKHYDKMHDKYLGKMAFAEIKMHENGKLHLVFIYGQPVGYVSTYYDDFWNDVSIKDIKKCEVEFSDTGKDMVHITYYK